MVHRYAGLVPLVLLVCGCSGASQQASSPNAAATGRAASPLLIPEGETWDVAYVQGSPMGHMQTVTRTMERDGKKLLEVEAQMQMSVQRFGDKTAPAASFKTWETLDGRLLSFESQQQLGPTMQSARGEVRNGELVIDTTTTGKTITSKIPWKEDYGGFFALKHSLQRRPMQPGEQRTIQALAEPFNQLASYDCTAKEEEATKLLDGTQTLLRIDLVMRFANDNSIRSTIWCDRAGDVLKMRIESFGTEFYRTTKERALAGAGATATDLGLATIVRVDQPLRKPHQTRRVRYEVSLKGEPGSPDSDPAKVFPSGSGQQVKPVSANTAELIVSAVRPQSGPAAEAAVPPTEADLQANNLIQSDHPLITQMAGAGGGEQTDRLQLALALERHVRQSVRNKNFTQRWPPPSTWRNRSKEIAPSMPCCWPPWRGRKTFPHAWPSAWSMWKACKDSVITCGPSCISTMRGFPSMPRWARGVLAQRT